MGQANPVVGGSARRRHVLATRARACAAHSEGCAAADGGRRAALVAMDRGGRLRGIRAVEVAEELVD